MIPVFLNTTPIKSGGPGKIERLIIGKIRIIKLILSTFMGTQQSWWLVPFVYFLSGFYCSTLGALAHLWAVELGLLIIHASCCFYVAGSPAQQGAVLVIALSSWFVFAAQWSLGLVVGWLLWGVAGDVSGIPLCREAISHTIIIWILV